MTRTPRRRLTGASLAAVGMLSAGLVFGGAAAADASPMAPTTASGSDCSIGDHLRSIFAAMPAELRSDLKDLRGLPAAERRAAALAIRRDALAGEYGDGVQFRAKQIAKFRVGIWKDMPDELKADLVELKSMAPGADRRAAAAEIAQAAVAGSYGTAVQDAAEKIQDSELWKSCVAD